MAAKLRLWIACAAAVLTTGTSTGYLGVNWGTQASHPLKPPIAVKMLKANGINKVKLFDADPWAMDSLAGSGIEVMVGIPNLQLQGLADDYDDAKAWVKKNVLAYDHDGGVNVKYVAVGNEAFLVSYNGSFLNSTLPAIKNIQRALDDAGLGGRVKAVTPLNADVYGSPESNNVPSAGSFRSDIHDLMVELVRYLRSNDAPFVVNVYPFLSLYQNDNFPMDYAFFDGGGRTVNDRNLQYNNVFDANVDTLIWSLKKAGVGDMKVIIGEAGWPTDGDKNADLHKAKRFYDGFLKKLAEKKGTPLRPGVEMEVYLFGLLDENQKSILPGPFERHWGIFQYDGRPKFPMDLSGKNNNQHLTAAQGVEYLPKQWCVLNVESNIDESKIAEEVSYACEHADCTPLGAGGSCNSLERSKSISYAFNIYYQMQDQDVRACNFAGLGKVMNWNMSTRDCLFPVEIISLGEKVRVTVGVLVAMAVGLVMVLC